MKFQHTAIVAAAALALSGAAFAQKAGTISLSVGITHLAPSVTSGNLTAPSLPNTQADVGSDTALTGGISYMVTDNIAISVPLGLGFKHEMIGAGAIAGVGKLAEVRALPVTVLGQYRFMEANAKFRPYLGAGLTYAKFYKEQGTGVLTAITNPGGPATTITVASKLVPTVQLGLIFDINDKWFVDTHYVKTFLKTRGTLSTGQTLDITLNPDAYSILLGYKF